MRVVLDTNVLLAAFISPRGAPAQLVDLWLKGAFDLVTSEWQLEEFRRASRYERVRGRIAVGEVGTFVNTLRKNAIVLERLPSLTLSPDPDDDAILATAISGKAHYLVTGDKGDMQSLEKVQGVRIMAAREFLTLIA